MADALKEIGCNKCFGGFLKRYQHQSDSVQCTMKFQVYFPPGAVTEKFPVIYWLSGLTCTDENFMVKAGAQRVAAELGVALITPDTSPRGLNVEGESDSWDFGVAAGFYLNATVEKWKNWRMYDYVTKELPQVLAANFPNLDTSRASIMGHSMGGHGALTIALKNPLKYKCVSAFAPICHPINCAWGQKAFTGYLGAEDKSKWEEYDATVLVERYNGPKMDVLIDQGGNDQFLKDNQLQPEAFVEASKKNNVAVTLRIQEGYDHSYYFIATFIEDHLKRHARALFS
ncbi:hypothetical protein CBR_g12387 [Chara braunii]|uniref:S-formylglutathione hydrolase n=1 Tax=Chara braunii TaxID=69332 RepID=A0A388KRX5_CHABU|nr:hypothetical protein CBR_g12387 [Chara braunii]|eukprot:GBG72820.1 hypothetical protein CBR_g12387 [Chara braunii]